MTHTNELMTAEELADQFRVSPQTIHSWRKEGRIPAIRISSKVIRYDFDEIVEAIRKTSDEGAEKGGDRDAH